VALSDCLVAIYILADNKSRKIRTLSCKRDARISNNSSKPLVILEVTDISVTAREFRTEVDGI
jgi:hypothetical protein